MEKLKSELITLSILKKMGLNILNKEDLKNSEVINTDNYFESYYKYMNKFQNDFNRSIHKNEFPAIGEYMNRINDEIIKASYKDISISISILRIIYNEYDEKCDNDQMMINRELIIKQYHLF